VGVVVLRASSRGTGMVAFHRTKKPTVPARRNAGRHREQGAEDLVDGGKRGDVLRKAKKS